MSTTESETYQKYYWRRALDDREELAPSTFATIYRRAEVDNFHDWDQPGATQYDVYEVLDKETHEVITFDTTDELQDFIDLDVGVREYSRYRSTLEAIRDAANCLPVSSIVDGFMSAANSALRDKLALARRIRTGDEKIITLDEIYISFRELNFAFSAIAAALAVGAGQPQADYLAHAWLIKGKIPSNGVGAYNAVYDVCNDTYVDEGDQDQPEDGDYFDGYPEIHYPGELEVRVDPLKRIEFKYTPKLESARSHHHSHSQITYTDGRQRKYDNCSLSIRIDLDPDSPAGINLDVARSDMDGPFGSDGKKIQRQGDLVGKVLAAASPDGSHRYEGFTPAMANEFRTFAERLALQLYLQGKEVGKREIGRSVIGKVA